ncbi:MAG: pseudouridine synthase [Comamonadaceae bacterium]|nr:MAG: pseudouridine synthase [Comamonadaceae bacterium]
MPFLHILWRDDHLIAVYKPAGWLVHRTGLDAGETRFVMQTLRNQIGQHVYPVHRLDKGTCGVLVMALNPTAARALSQAFEHHAVRKRYLALVRGWAPEAAEVDHALRPDDAPPDAPVQSAHTLLRRLARLELPESSDPRFAATRASLVEAWPTTGRRHQIRRHLKHIAHPILGDATHGKGPLNRWWAERLGHQRLWLHAWQLSVPHPVSGEPLQLHSGLPPLLALWPSHPHQEPHGPHAPAPGGQAPDGLPADARQWLQLHATLPWHEDEPMQLRTIA